METPDVSVAQWFALQVWGGREASCAAHLRSRGFEVLLPLCLERRRWSDRVKEVERALFPGYLFCRLDPHGLWQVVQSPGVTRVVGDGRRPSPVPDDEISAVERIVSSGIPADPWGFLRVGQRVRVEVGPLRGVEGIVLATDGKPRLVVSVSLLQRSVAVQMEADWLTPLDRPARAGGTSVFSAGISDASWLADGKAGL